MNKNKNVSIWRGDTPPPSKFHLWQKNNKLYHNDGIDWIENEIDNASNESDGLMSKEDKERLDNLVYDGLDSNDQNRALSANQGNVLLGKIETIKLSAYKVKGSVENISDIPLIDIQQGDVYNILNSFYIDNKKYPEGTNVVWTGTQFDPLGGTVDFKDYSTTEQIEEIVTTLENNVNNSLDNLNSIKSDKTYVNSQLATKADITYVDNKVSPKADTIYVDNKVSLKADKTYVDTQLATKVDKVSGKGLSSNDFSDRYKFATQTLAQILDIKNETQNGVIDIVSNVCLGTLWEDDSRLNVGALIPIANHYTFRHKIDGSDNEYVELSCNTYYVDYYTGGSNLKELFIRVPIDEHTYTLLHCGIHNDGHGYSWIVKEKSNRGDDVYDTTKIPYLFSPLKYTDDKVSPKADKTYVDTQLATKANTGYVNAQVEILTTALETKVNKVSGKGLSTNDYTTEEKNLVSTIPSKATEEYVDENIKLLAKQRTSFVTPCFSDCDSTHEAKCNRIKLAGGELGFGFKTIFSVTIKIAENLSLRNYTPTYLHIKDLSGNSIGVSMNGVKQMQNLGKYATWFFDSAINTSGAPIVLSLHTTNVASSASDSNLVKIIAHVNRSEGMTGCSVTDENGTSHTDWTPALGINVVNLSAIYPQIKELQKYRMAYATSELPDISTTGHKANVKEIRINQNVMGISLVNSVSIMVASDSAYSGAIQLRVYDINDNLIATSNNTVNLSQNLGKYVTWYFTPFQLNADAIYKFSVWNSGASQVMRIHVASGKSEGVTCFDQNNSPHTDYCPAFGINISAIFADDLNKKIKEVNLALGKEISTNSGNIASLMTTIPNKADKEYVDNKVKEANANANNAAKIRTEDMQYMGVAFDSEVMPTLRFRASEDPTSKNIGDTITFTDVAGMGADVTEILKITEGQTIVVENSGMPAAVLLSMGGNDAKIVAKTQTDEVLCVYTCPFGEEFIYIYGASVKYRIYNSDLWRYLLSGKVAETVNECNILSTHTKLLGIGYKSLASVDGKYIVNSVFDSVSVGSTLTIQTTTNKGGNMSGIITLEPGQTIATLEKAVIAKYDGSNFTVVAVCDESKFGYNDNKFTYFCNNGVNAINVAVWVNRTNDNIKYALYDNVAWELLTEKNILSKINAKADTTYVNTQLASKVDKMPGMGLSDNNYTNEEREKLARIQYSEYGCRAASVYQTEEINVGAYLPIVAEYRVGTAGVSGGFYVPCEYYVENNYGKIKLYMFCPNSKEGESDDNHFIVAEPVGGSEWWEKKWHVIERYNKWDVPNWIESKFNRGKVSNSEFVEQKESVASKLSALEARIAALEAK